MSGPVRIELPAAETFKSRADAEAAEILSLKSQFSQQLEELAGVSEGKTISASLDADGEFTRAANLLHDRLVHLGETLLLHAQQISAMDTHSSGQIGN